MKKPLPLQVFLRDAVEDLRYALELEERGELDAVTKREVSKTVNNLHQRFLRDIKKENA